jgi:hypothetical protein
VKRHKALIPLSREHNTALVLALRIEREAQSADAAMLMDVYDTLISFWARGLLPHFRTENECLLARLVRHVEDSDELITRTHRDHLGLEALVAEMRDNVDLEKRRRLLLDFAGRLRTHVRWEEDVLFQSTQEMLTGVELDALAWEVQDRVGEGNTPLNT